MKKIIVLAFVFMLTFASNAFAHTGLESSTPSNGQVIQEELKDITLTFEGKIEQGSSFEVRSTDGATISVDNISINDGQMTGTLSNALENGDYEVIWNIVGADGHPIEGSIPFTVEVATATTPVDEDIVEDAETIAAPSTDQAEQVDEVQTTSDKITIVIIALIVVVVAAFFWLRRKN